jgi:transposase
VLPWPIPQDKALYLKRRRIENKFARLKDWRPITMSYADAPTL